MSNMTTDCKSCDCSVIRDLLPLYADGETSPETSRIIKEHVAECEDCRGMLRHYDKIPHSLEQVPAGKFGKYHYSEVARRIRRRNTIQLSVVCGTFLTIGFIISKILFSDNK